MSEVRKQKCPVCGYEMTLPFENRCPICIKYDDNVQLPVNVEALLSVKPLEKKPEKKGK
ncbi:hypothetical protein TVAG_185640 [Trichomonas vaginalis G3]|uniref:Uncharacterized protein n=1 Tax=Trichomonas vaginalis (strain ATCC PRA-98 / G3) TaxID=412133 RepID=A2D8K8_TRIV3|nr:hypothetical protein TVAGG3_0392630 [Trichomonas vaginalis G3]EAY23257.1 hypothetical protein TVAG_185640 [Trichomonas vaginalis G3]KAI5534094.1 hypothetical protein TVAGG3_0392630 [Trichomonas vaginalis G3]|eukprot:XP_001584243.1 hypothetical protein [Trichomonas vaginalis G3]